MVGWSYLGLVVVGFVAYRFLKGLGRRIPIIELLLLIAGLQWIVGAFIEYRTPFQHFKYYMYVDEPTYMSYVVPAYLCFVLVAFFKTRKVVKSSPDITQFTNYSKYGVLLLGLGIFFDIAGVVVPGGLKFIFYLLANFKYIGVIILFFSEQKRHRNLFYGGIVLLVLRALASALFHELILWGAFFYMFYALRTKPSIRFNVMVIVLGIIVGTFIQAVKADYRARIWGGFQGNYVSLFVDILNKRITGGLTEDSRQQEELNVRLNQGWIISAIMDYTPRVQAFSEGATIKEAVFASALPRFLNPNKTEAGGVENFEKFTGLELEDGTSMGMSLVGEAYVNYGVRGGIGFMAIWGFVIGWVWVYLNKRIKHNPIIIFFLPLIFLQVVKAETELVVVLNHLVKATILIFGFFWFTKKVVGIEFENE